MLWTGAVPTAIQRGFSPAWEGLLDDYPSYRAYGPERIDNVGNCYQHFVCHACGEHGLLVKWVGGGKQIYWRG